MDLAAHRNVQRLAYECAVEIGASFEVGVTEKEAALRMRRWLEARGVDDWFHLPFAWFGDRTAFVGLRQPLEFFPTSRRLERGMPFILDCAPVVGGVAADIGYTSSLGPNPIVDKLLDDLAAHRDLIVSLVKQRETFAEVYRAVDRLIVSQGYRNRHRAYPFGVMAHEVRTMAAKPIRLTIGGFGVESLRSLGTAMALGLRRRVSPLWNDSRLSEHPPTPGLWAVEPHIGFGTTGAKFEELLVVTEDDAYWLDDELPHVARNGKVAA